MPNFLQLSFTLVRCFVAISLLCPIAILSAFATFLVYLYLRYEGHFNSRLVRNTPPGLDDHLPIRSEWFANGGLKKFTPPQPKPGSDEEDCTICYHTPEDPVQIAKCEHTFCQQCLDAWLAKGHRACPQCTTNLWREEQTEATLTERAAKLTAAEALVSVPLTIYIVYTCLSYHIFYRQDRISWLQLIFLIAFILLSIFMLLMIYEGCHWALQSRRTKGTGWWGANLEPGVALGYKMTMIGLSEAGALWLAILSLVLQVNVEWDVPIVWRLVVGGVMLPIVDRPWRWAEEERQAVRSREARRSSEDTVITGE